jgi:hypothetical protein
VDVAGFGLANYLFHLNHYRLLALVLLVPAAIRLLTDSQARTALWSDRLFVLYLIVRLALCWRETNITGGLRSTFLLVLDTALPYYVLSRSIRTLDHLRLAISGILLAIALIGTVALVESFRRWLIYDSLRVPWQIPITITNYLARDGQLRVQATAGNAISLGYAAMIAAGAYLYLRSHLLSGWGKRLLAFVLAGALAVPLSRGPWVGMVLVLAIFIAGGPRAPVRLCLFALTGVAAIAVLSILPGGGRIVELLPFIGDTERGTLTYRQELLENAIRLLQLYPLFGPPDYIEKLTDMGMKQGQGIVDIVNSYVQIAMESGMVGLLLFVGVFASLILNTFTVALRERRSSDAASAELSLIGRALAATMVGIAVTISAASSIGPIPWLYWSIAGLSSAYLALARQHRLQLSSTPRPNRPSNHRPLTTLST